jgi:hypothetical protein
MKYATIATISTYLPSINASQETQIWFIRNAYLTVQGIQRMIIKGCAETQFEPKTGSVVRIERALMEGRK